MQYRRLIKHCKPEISSLGLGGMRLPVNDNNHGRICEKRIDELLLTAHSVGINYIDTAYNYHNGNSERAISQALDRTGLRTFFYVATKSPIWLIKDQGDWDRYLDEQLQRLELECIPFYLLHALNKEKWDMTKKLCGLKSLIRAKHEGRIKYLGFSFHDSLPVFKTIIDEYKEWDFCQIQFNYIDIDFQAGIEGLRYAAANKVSTIAMGPLRGGVLAATGGKAITEHVTKTTRRARIELAFKFVLDREEIVCALSGMGTPSEVLQDAAIVDKLASRVCSPDENQEYEEARKQFNTTLIPCTSCGYCLPCDKGVVIPLIFACFNGMKLHNDRVGNDSLYSTKVVARGWGGDNCIRCGRCVEKCPQRLAIPKLIGEAHNVLMSR
jgi:uncharacterized protein